MSKRNMAFLISVFGVAALFSGTGHTQELIENSNPEADTVYIINADPSIISEMFVRIAEDVGPSVVTITSKTSVTAVIPSFPSIPFGFQDPWGRNWEDLFPAPREEEFAREGLGSGVIISEDGYIVTNHHVAGEADDIEVILSTGERYTATLIGTDPKADIAVIRIEADNLPSIRFGNSDDLQVGQWVLAIGSPFALSQTVTQGIVSYLGRSQVGLADYENYIQTDAAINPGNSGGALVNLSGELVGINTAIASRTGGYQGVGFAIPVNSVSDIMDELVEHGYVRRGWLGVTIQDINPELAYQFGLEDGASGVLIADVLEDTPAEECGIERGDVILSLNGEEVESVEVFRNRIASMYPGEEAHLLLVRDGREKRLVAILDQQPGSYVAAVSDDSTPEIGWSLSSLTEDTASRMGDRSLQGVLVEGVDRNGTAEAAGITRGDLLIEVNRKPVFSPEEVENIISGSNGDILLLVWRQGRTVYIVINR